MAVSLLTGVVQSDPEIFKYVRENNFDKLCEYLRNAPSLAVNELDSYGYTPLQVACSNKEGDERIIARLLEVPGGAFFFFFFFFLSLNYMES